MMAIWGVVLIGASGLGLMLFKNREVSRAVVSLITPEEIPVDKFVVGKSILSDQTPVSSPTPFQATLPDPETPLPDSSPSPQPLSDRLALPTGTPIPFSEGPMEIGLSIQDRPLEMFRFGTGPDIRVMVAGIHGGYEWNTVALADALIGHLRAHPELIPDQVTLFILRVMNPDGLARGQWYEGRLNENGVDLNRNFPTNWEAEWPNAGCWGHLAVSSGVGPASEPETQAVMAFLRQHRVTALISYHSAALGVFPGGIPLHLASVQLAQDISAVTTYPYPPYDTGCLYTGTLADWAAENGIAAVDLELHTHGDPDFVENLRILTLFLGWQPDRLSGR